MTDRPTGAAGDLPEDATKEQIQQEIETTRERLAASVDELAAKTDVKAQLGAAADQARSNAQAKAHQAQETVTAATTDAITTFGGLSPAVKALVAIIPAVIITLLIIRALRKR